MAAEDSDTRPTSAGSRGRAPPEDDHDKEEGEIGDDESSSHAPPPPAKHPLEHAWTFWFHNPQGKSKQASWRSSMRPIPTFSTVEDFWGLYNNIHRPSKLVVGADFHCFKEKIEPKWEDPICANGGKWTISCGKGKSDTLWLHTLLAMIGEQFDHGDEICGAVVSVRAKQERIAIWTKDAANEAAQIRSGNSGRNFWITRTLSGSLFMTTRKSRQGSEKPLHSLIVGLLIQETKSTADPHVGWFCSMLQSSNATAEC